MARASGVLSGGLIRLAAEKDWGELAERVDGEPSSVGGSDGAGRTLLHYVLWKRAPVSLLGAVLDADSGAAHGIDRDGRYPLHFAMCGHDAGAKYSAFVSKLIEATPAAAEAKDKHGRVPLHYAYWREASREVICAVQEAAPGVVSAMDKAGKKPVEYGNAVEANGSAGEPPVVEEPVPAAASVEEEDASAAEAENEAAEAAAMEAEEEKTRQQRDARVAAAAAQAAAEAEAEAEALAEAKADSADGEEVFLEEDDPFADMEDLLNDEPAAQDEDSPDDDGTGSDEPADDFAALEAMLG